MMSDGESILVTILISAGIAICASVITLPVSYSLRRVVLSKCFGIDRVEQVVTHERKLQWLSTGLWAVMTVVIAFGAFRYQAGAAVTDGDVAQLESLALRLKTAEVDVVRATALNDVRTLLEARVTSWVPPRLVTRYVQVKRSITGEILEMLVHPPLGDTRTVEALLVKLYEHGRWPFSLDELRSIASDSSRPVAQRRSVVKLLGLVDYRGGFVLASAHRLVAEFTLGTPTEVRCAACDALAYMINKHKIVDFLGAQAAVDALKVLVTVIDQQDSSVRVCALRSIRLIAETHGDYNWRHHLLVSGDFDGIVADALRKARADANSEVRALGSAEIKVKPAIWRNW